MALTVTIPANVLWLLAGMALMFGLMLLVAWAGNRKKKA